jgi:class 3 adenylate cyclase
MRSDLPSGTVTFLFTDVEGSTRLLHSLGAEPLRRRWYRIRAQLDEAAFAEAWGEGRKLSPDEAVALAFASAE